MGYGQCSYLRLIDHKQRVHCSLIMAKSRVTPIKPVTIPRLELAAALTSVKVSCALIEELDISNVVEWFWTDSKVVLGYIGNDSRCFHVFVANRVQQIRDHTEPYQWSYVCSAENPADMASRGATPEELANKGMWFKGPELLWKSSLPFKPRQEDTKPRITEGDPEVRSSFTFMVSAKSTTQTSIIHRVDYFSSWKRAVRAVAWCLKYKRILKNHILHGQEHTKENRAALSVTELQQAEVEILRQIQRETFGQELMDVSKPNPKALNSRSKGVAHIKCTSPLYRLDPLLDRRFALCWRSFG